MMPSTDLVTNHLIYNTLLRRLGLPGGTKPGMVHGTVIGKVEGGYDVALDLIEYPAFLLTTAEIETRQKLLLRFLYVSGGKIWLTDHTGEDADFAPGAEDFSPPGAVHSLADDIPAHKMSPSEVSRKATEIINQYSSKRLFDLIPKVAQASAPSFFKSCDVNPKEVLLARVETLNGYISLVNEYTLSRSLALVCEGRYFATLAGSKIDFVKSPEAQNFVEQLLDENSIFGIHEITEPMIRPLIASICGHPAAKPDGVASNPDHFNYFRGHIVDQKLDACIFVSRRMAFTSETHAIYYGAGNCLGAYHVETAEFAERIDFLEEIVRKEQHVKLDVSYLGAGHTMAAPKFSIFLRDEN